MKSAGECPCGPYVHQGCNDQRRCLGEHYSSRSLHPTRAPPSFLSTSPLTLPFSLYLLAQASFYLFLSFSRRLAPSLSLVVPFCPPDQPAPRNYSPSQPRPDYSKASLIERSIFNCTRMAWQGWSAEWQHCQFQQQAICRL